MLGDDGGVDFDDVRPVEAAGQEGADGLLVGGVEDGRVGGGGGHGRAGQVDRGESLRVQGLEVPGDGLLSGVGGHEPGQVRPGGPGQAQGDGQAHIGRGGLGQGGAVDELDHGVDDGLRVDDDDDIGRVDVEQQVRL